MRPVPAARVQAGRARRRCGRRPGLGPAARCSPTSPSCCAGAGRRPGQTRRGRGGAAGPRGLARGGPCSDPRPAARRAAARAGRLPAAPGQAGPRPHAAVHGLGGSGRRGRLCDTTPLAQRPAEMAVRLVSRHQAGDLILGEARSAVGTLAPAGPGACFPASPPPPRPLQAPVTRGPPASSTAAPAAPLAAGAGCCGGGVLAHRGWRAGLCRPAVTVGRHPRGNVAPAVDAGDTALRAALRSAGRGALRDRAAARFLPGPRRRAIPHTVPEGPPIRNATSPEAIP